MRKALVMLGAIMLIVTAACNSVADDSASVSAAMLPAESSASSEAPSPADSPGAAQSATPRASELTSAALVSTAATAGTDSISTTAANPHSTESARVSLDLSEVLASVDIDCAGQHMVGDVDCTRNGESIKILNAPFADSEALRRRACDGGYVNAGYLVAVGDGFSISADTNATTQDIAKVLKLDVETFCPKK